MYDGSDVYIALEAGNVVGAIPLLSPTSGMLDYGLVIQPRFPWPGIGPMLAEMGWRIAPTPLKLPLLKRSERKVPLWVISCMVLVRLKALLDSLSRRFELVNENRSAPRGTVRWSQYATRNLATGQFLSVPCTFPDLRDDRLLVGAIRYSLEKQRSALESQRQHGSFVHQLIAFCNQLLRRVQHNPPFLPSPNTLASWLQRPLRIQYFREGLQAIEWTIEDRGLAGVSDLEGIPWRMPMEQFFEAWVETVFRSVARQIGAELRVGRRRETVHPINWEPPYLGSQKALIPDIWLDWGSTTLIVDAKYKRHWDELEEHSWRSVEEMIREQHRSDLFQVLAYANLARKARVIVCLAYPCTPTTWERMVLQNRVVHKAEINTGMRSILLWLTAIPMATEADKISAPLLQEVRSAAA
ncbi:MAG: 5-methylcytosine restriction system specificity protein McrC [Candidatus Korobacteraceae bacterium]